MFVTNLKVPTNSHHATSHANMSTFANTPINRKTFTSATVNGSSSRIDSDKKYKYPSNDLENDFKGLYDLYLNESLEEAV